MVLFVFGISSYRLQLQFHSKICHSLTKIMFVASLNTSIFVEMKILLSLCSAQVMKGKLMYGRFSLKKAQFKAL